MTPTSAEPERLRLARLPTPIEPLARLRPGSTVLVKRDDLTDLALGGDKPRKLEYEVAKARASGATTASRSRACPGVADTRAESTRP